MMRLLFLITAVLMFSSCTNTDDDKPVLSQSTQITSFSLASNDYEPLEVLKFINNELTGEISNSDSIPSSISLKKLKVIIDSPKNSSMLINDQPWDGVDSVNYASSIKITIIAEDRDYKQDYLLKINTKRQNTWNLDSYKAQASGNMINPPSTYNTMFFEIINDGRGYLYSGMVGADKFGLWYTAPFNCIVNINISTRDLGMSASPKFEILNRDWKVIFTSNGFSNETFSIYLEERQNIKMRLISDNLTKNNIYCSILVNVKL